MVERVVVERMIRDLHAARVAGDLQALCRLFAERGRFRISGASADKPIEISADGIAGFRPWLSMMLKVFRISDYLLETLVIEDARGVAQWRANIHSKITGVTVPTELVDLVEVSEGRIVSYREFFVPS